MINQSPSKGVILDNYDSVQDACKDVGFPVVVYDDDTEFEDIIKNSQAVEAVEILDDEYSSVIRIKHDDENGVKVD